MHEDTDVENHPVRILRADVSEALLARQAIGEVHRRRLDSDKAVADFLANESCYLLIAATGDEVVGSLNGYALTHPHRRQLQFLLYDIDVKESWRQRGIGSSLINAFVAEARKKGAFEVWVLTNQSNEAAMAMYRKCGFTRSNSDDAMFSLAL